MSRTHHDQKLGKHAGSRSTQVGDRSPFAESQELSVLFALGVLGLSAKATARRFAHHASSVFPRPLKPTKVSALRS